MFSDRHKATALAQSMGEPPARLSIRTAPPTESKTTSTVHRPCVVLRPQRTRRVGRRRRSRTVRHRRSCPCCRRFRVPAGPRAAAQAGRNGGRIAGSPAALGAGWPTGHRVDPRSTGYSTTRSMRSWPCSTSGDGAHLKFAERHQLSRGDGSVGRWGAGHSGSPSRSGSAAASCKYVPTSRPTSSPIKPDTASRVPTLSAVRNHPPRHYLRKLASECACIVRNSGRTR